MEQYNPTALLRKNVDGKRSASDFWRSEPDPTYPQDTAGWFYLASR